MQWSQRGRRGKNIRAPTTPSIDLEDSSRQRIVIAESSLEGFLSDRSTHTLTAYNTEEGTDMHMLAHLHTIFSLRPAWCGIFMVPLGIPELCSVHIRSERMQAYTVETDNKQSI